MDNVFYGPLKGCGLEFTPQPMSIIMNQVLSARQLAVHLGVTYQWLGLLRKRGEGPPYFKLNNKHVRYRACDVESWQLSRRRTS